jgi:phosphatidylinositol alpha-mannosyltransferase
MKPAARAACEFLGRVSDADKAALLRSADVYVAPHTGGESFGIVLVEAMAAGTPVLASDLPAFKKVLEDGAAGALFRNEDSDDLARQLTGLLGDDDRRRALTATGNVVVRRYDWAAVAGQIVRVYETVVGGAA